MHSIYFKYAHKMVQSRIANSLIISLITMKEQKAEL